MRRVRRTLRWLLFFALLGAATTVVVAWGLALSLPKRMSRVDTYAVQGEARLGVFFYSIEEYHSLGMTRRIVRPESGYSFSRPSALRMAWWERSIAREQPDFVPPSAVGDWGVLPAVVRGCVDLDAYEAVDDARGWPCLALWSSWGLVDAGAPGTWAWTSRVSYGVRVGAAPLPSPSVGFDDSANFRAIPLMPIWRGLAINTAFYAAAWAGLIFGFTGLRTFTRLRRGHCPRCGYDLRGDFANGCPECGWRRAAVPT